MTAAILPDLQEPREPVGARVFKLAAVLTMHFALLGWLMQLSPASPPAAPATPMQVRMIETVPPPSPPTPLPPRAEPPKPAATAPKPLAQEKRPAARPTPAPRPALAAAPESAPSSTPFAVAPQPAAQEKQEVAVAQPTTPAAPAAPVAVATPARFDADYLQNPAPAYPAVSKRLREEGTVLLLVRVSAKGEAERVQIQQGSGFARLDDVAVKTVQQWRFVPARRGAEAVTASVVVPIVFRLDS